MIGVYALTTYLKVNWLFYFVLPSQLRCYENEFKWHTSVYVFQSNVIQNTLHYIFETQTKNIFYF